MLVTFVIIDKANAEDFIVLTLSGMAISVRFMQHANAPFPIEVILSGRTIPTRDSQPKFSSLSKNASSGISVSPIVPLRSRLILAPEFSHSALRIVAIVSAEISPVSATV